MNHSSGDLVTRLGGLASGTTVAALMLVPQTPWTAYTSPPMVEPAMQTISTVALNEGGATGFGSSSFALHPHLHGFTVLAPIDSNGIERDRRATNLASQLKDASGLGVVTLAKIVGVSRVRYHQWLREGGIGPDKVPHVRSLIAFFRNLRPLIGSDMRGFVRSDSPTGPIEDLLRQGEMKAVMGLALRPGAAPARKPLQSLSAERVTGTPRWIRPARRLAWETSDAGSQHHKFVLDEYGASWRGPDLYLQGADVPDDEDTGIVHVVYES